MQEGFNMDWIDEARKQREINHSKCYREEAINYLLDALNCNDSAMEKGEVSFCQWVLTEKYIKFSIKFIQEKKQVGWFLDEVRKVMIFAQEKVRRSS
jgi:hypothetical protein